MKNVVDRSLNNVIVYMSCRSGERERKIKKLLTNDDGYDKL
ncbi:hypothetical protein CLOHYLEM_06836 [[Clostridium] hylemonae DSM 15053]|uniref:Uncharacterized protein n=1 Tax=[Clostridium] hylemonae DSM 15053 TaxID=553973 RepID=C0C421_9FIRM|nr:hypothetical protein CLOHYLEM_06836 [[Clostridium] hylemonae DSM 15053]